MNIQVGDFIMYKNNSDIRIDKIIQVDLYYSRLLCYDYAFRSKYWIRLDFYEDCIIGKLHPILVKLWRLDERY